MGHHKKGLETGRRITVAEEDRRKAARKKELNEAWDKMCAAHGANPSDVNRVVGSDRVTKPLTVDPAAQGLRQAVIKRGSGVLFQVLRPETEPIRSMASADTSFATDSELLQDLEDFTPAPRKNRKTL